MSWDGNGNFARTNGTQNGSTTWANARDAGNNITASQHDTHDQDLADGIAACLTKNGESKPTADFKPNADATYSLGSAAARWINLYLSGFIGDGSGNELLKFSATASAVNELTATNAATATNPYFAATGGDTNIGIELRPKGTGKVTFTDGTDTTKKLAIDVSAVTTGTKRTATVPDYDFRLGNFPAGVVVPYAGASVPTGWLYCDGSAVSRTTYADLFTAVGTTWGAGNGSTTFNLPSLLGKFPLGDGQNIVSEDVAAASISTGSDTATVTSNNAKWISGQCVRATTSGGLPAGLSTGTDYFIIRASATTIKFATSLANAQNGTAIDLTTQGTGTHTFTTSGATAQSYASHTLGEQGGEEGHAQSSTELLAHTHTITQTTQTGVAGQGWGGTASGGGNSPVTSSSTGGNAAANVLNPFVSMKYIISY